MNFVPASNYYIFLVPILDAGQTLEVEIVDNDGAFVVDNDGAQLIDN